MFDREGESEKLVFRSDLTGLTDNIVNNSIKLDKQVEKILEET